MRLALIGYGKMGHEIEKIARARGHEIVSVIDKDNVEDIDSEAFGRAEVVIEFTSPDTAYANCMKAFERGKKVVSGSTGWMDRHGDEMKRRCEEEHQTLFWSSNFSLGVYVFFTVNKYLAHIMDNFPNYDVSMSETHHIHKLDAPSGTAITLAEEILKCISRKTKWVEGTRQAPDGTVSAATCGGPEELSIDSIRTGEVPGIHSVRYDSEADRITFTHEAKNRKGLALGAVLAAEFTADHEGFLKMEDLFQF